MNRTLHFSTIVTQPCVSESAKISGPRRRFRRRQTTLGATASFELKRRSWSAPTGATSDVLELFAESSRGGGLFEEISHRFHLVKSLCDQLVA